MLQEGLLREVCFNSVFAQVTHTQDRFCPRLPRGTRVASDSQIDLTLSTILIVFFRPRFGVGPNHLVGQQRILQTT